MRRAATKDTTKAERRSVKPPLPCKPDETDDDAELPVLAAWDDTAKRQFDSQCE